MKIKFEEITGGPRPLFAAMVEPDRKDMKGRVFKGTSAVRVVKESEGWRVDRCDVVGGAWTPWEPVTEQAFPTAKEGMRAAEAWAKKFPR